MGILSSRREFMAALGGAAALPIAARGQQAAVPVIGFLGGESRDSPPAGRVRAFHQGLSEFGYAEGHNVAIEYRWADGQYDRLPDLAADLVRRQVAVIAAIGATPTALAAKAATTTIPIVFQNGINPIEAGLVASLNRPGGNLTGVTNLSAELVPKRLELLHEVVPKATVIGVLVNPTNAISTKTVSDDAEAAARQLGLQVRMLHASNEREIDNSFAALIQLQASALVIGSFSFFNGRSEKLAALALRHAIPAIFQNRLGRRRS
jgi:putative ABC transport system substrate-binding protein